MLKIVILFICEKKKKLTRRLFCNAGADEKPGIYFIWPSTGDSRITWENMDISRFTKYTESSSLFTQQKVHGSREI